MRAGSIKHGGKVRHGLRFSHTSSINSQGYYDLICTEDRKADDQINFKSNAPACKNCIAKLRADRARTTRNLAKLGVK